MDYKNGKIYQILNNVNDDVYVGSTTQPLCKRLYKHKADTKRRNFKIHKLIREIGEDKFYIELIESYPCNSKEELNAREGHYIRERGTLNMKIAGRTDKAYYKDNKEHIDEYQKRYREANKEFFNHCKKQYYENNKEHIKSYKKQYHKDNQEHLKEVNKQWREINKEHIKEVTEQYRENNKERILERINCDICGCQVIRTNIARHQKTLKCKSHVKPIENEE